MDPALFLNSNIVELKTFPLAEEKCDKCGTTGKMVGRISLNTMSLFFIPFVPMGRTYMTICTDCKKVNAGAAIPHETRDKMRAESKKIPHRVGYYAGLIIIVGLLLFFAIKHQITGD